MHLYSQQKILPHLSSFTTRISPLTHSRLLHIGKLSAHSACTITNTTVIKKPTKKNSPHSPLTEKPNKLGGHGDDLSTAVLWSRASARELESTREGGQGSRKKGSRSASKSICSASRRTTTSTAVGETNWGSPTRARVYSSGFFFSVEAVDFFRGGITKPWRDNDDDVRDGARARRESWASVCVCVCVGDELGLHESKIIQYFCNDCLALVNYWKFISCLGLVSQYEKYYGLVLKFFIILELRRRAAVSDYSL